MNNINDTNDNYFSANSNDNFLINKSLIKMIQKEFNSFLKNIQNGLDIFNEEKILKSLSSTIINNLISLFKKKIEKININELNQNITIYLSYFLKSLYYEQIINENLKFINKEYKNTKKELQNIISELSNEKKKVEILKSDIHEHKNIKENNIQNLNNKLMKNNLINNFKSQNNNYNNKNQDKIDSVQNYNTEPLFNIIFCYIRKIESKFYQKYCPIQIEKKPNFKKSNHDSLTKPPYCFTKATISLNKSYKTLRIVLTNKLDPIDINIKEIQYTSIRMRTKIISEVYQDYQKFVKRYKEKVDKETFINNEMIKYNNLSQDYINRCIENNKFNIMLHLEKEKMIEFVFCCYEEFKIWVNGFAFIIKNKDNLLKV